VWPAPKSNACAPTARFDAAAKMNSHPLPRSYLFVPGDRPERFGKALASGADAVIVDLEDAVAPAAKAAARAAVAAWLDAGHGPIVLRVNGADSAWFADDLALAAKPGVAAVMLAKAERVADLARVRTAAPDAALLPLVETAAGIDRLRELAAAPGVQRLALGTIDLALDLGVADEEALAPLRIQFVLASRLAGLAPPVDGVCTAIEDAALLAAEAQRARRCGFGAKLAIHPRQIAVIHAALAPSAEEIAWAERVLAAAAAAQGAAVAVDGRMVDAPVLARAQAVLQQAGRARQP
jgi:citrate lyase subunit beta/citryl-CoA lyase